MRTVNLYLSTKCLARHSKVLLLISPSWWCVFYFWNAFSKVTYFGWASLSFQQQFLTGSYKHRKGPEGTEKNRKYTEKDRKRHREGPKRPIYNATEKDTCTYLIPERRLYRLNLVGAVYIVNIIVMSMQIRYWNNCASNIGTTVDQGWHDNVVNVGMPTYLNPRMG